MARNNYNKQRKGSISVAQAEDNGSRVLNALLATILVLLGIMAAEFSKIWTGNFAQIYSTFLPSYGNLGGFYINFVAVVGLTYTKASFKYKISSATYLASLAAIFVSVHIVIQAIAMEYPWFGDYAPFFRSRVCAIVGHILYFGTIFAIAYSSGNPDIVHKSMKK